MKSKAFVALAVLMSTRILVAAPASSPARAPTLPQVDHVVIVEFENIDYANAMAQPTFSSIAKNGANLSNFFAETHPSQPNYLAMVAGDTFGYKTDSNVNIDARHIGDLLEEAGKTWKVYADDYPGNCFLGARSGAYVRKHVPFLSFKNIQSNHARCASIVAGTELKSDLSAGTLPNYSLYIPNLNDDGHDTGVAYADNWVKNTFLPLLKSTLPPRTLVVFTFDESSFFGGNHIYTAFYGDVVKAGSTFSNRTDHYGFLRTIESLFGLPDLGKNDANAAVIDGIWNLDPIAD
ncbi:MAG: hypothetical protein H7249_02510 [Chitinophagaceae bacterium]|nr:hypothetical protein [Oligoflexus sp.]